MPIPPDGPEHIRDLFAGQEPVHLYELPVPALGQPSVTITEAIAAAILHAERTDVLVQFDFNGLPIRVAADTNPDLIARDIKRPSARLEVALGHAVIGPYPRPVLTEDEVLEDVRLTQQDERAAANFREKLAVRKTLMRLLSDLPPLEMVEVEERDRADAIGTFGHDAEFRIAYTAGLDWATLVQHYVDTVGMSFPNAAAQAMEIMDTTHIFNGENEYRPVSFAHGFYGWKYEREARDWINNWLYPPETDISGIAHLDPDS